MTTIKMQNAWIEGESLEDGVFSITICCRREDMRAVICEHDHLMVEISRENETHAGRLQ